MTTYYILPLFIASTLIFCIQPLVGKILLPDFGGSAYVWNSCVIFFQTCLLLGYIAANYLVKISNIKKQIIIYNSILVVTLIYSLCIYNSNILFSISDLAPFISAGPTKIIFSLLITLGLPMIVLSATSPLIQKWYSGTNFKYADNPYPFYSFSNVGNIIGLFGYLLVLEYFFGLSQQYYFWELLFVCLLLLLFICSLITLKSYNNQDIKNKTYNKYNDSRPSNKLILIWLLLSLLPVSAMLGLTQVVTSNITSVPLIWIVPLVIYILSFSLAFSNKLNIRISSISTILLIAALFSIIFYPIDSNKISSFYINLIVLALLGTACHYKLYKTRPTTQHLTLFYVILSLGGIIGSLFNTYLAPIIFSDFYEYHIAIIAALILLNYKKIKLINDSYILIFFALFLLALFLRSYTYYLPLATLVLFTFWHIYKNRNLSAITALIIISILVNTNQSNIKYKNRNIYGKQTIIEENNKNYLISGNTVHGSQPSNSNKIALSYYRPVQDILHKINNPLKIIVAGMGAGTMSCLKKANDILDFIEINPEMVKIATNYNFFNYTKNCPPENIIIGDGRSIISQSGKHQYDVAILDAFSSGSVPMHLLTLEALQSYKDIIANDGIILFNISNRYVNLLPILTSNALKINMQALFLVNDPKTKDEFKSTWIAVTNNPKILENTAWQEINNDKYKDFVFTDDFNNIFTILRV